MRQTTNTSTRVTYLFFFCVLSMLLPLVAHAATYYVNGTLGNNIGNDGSEAEPWKTINHAVSMSSGQDNIYISSETYIESIDLKPIPKRGLHLVGLGTGSNMPVIQSPDPDKHTIETFDFSGTLQNLAVTGATNANGMNLPGSSSAAQILGCLIYGNRFGIHVTGTSAPRIRNNTIINNSTCGIANMLTSSATIDGNQISENGTSPDGLAGICVRDQSFPVIQNNIIRANHHSGINIRDTAHPAIINNTLLNHREQGTTGTAIKVNQEQGIQSLIIVNNIIAHNDTGLLSQGGRPCTGNNFNNLYGNSTDVLGFVRGDQDISADPLLSASFCLLPSSPCIDTGTATVAPKQDINGITRPQGPGVDIGACEYLQRPTGESSSIPAVLLLLL